MSAWQIFVGLLFCIWVFSMGWVFAHGEVANECRRLGAFYVSDQVFQCQPKTNQEKGHAE